MLPNVRITGVLWGDLRSGRVMRTVLAPLEGVYRTVVGGRNALFDLGVWPTRDPALPAISIGNVSVGGTGKTPFASFVVGRLRALGARPGLVLRDYGGDELAVHRLLQPTLEIFAASDRVAGSARARAAGCDVVVLDDAFQHRRVRRVIDVVLVSADALWTTRCLPCGPLREPMRSTMRADLVVVTRKAASPESAMAIDARLRALGARSIAHVALSPSELLAVGDDAARPIAPDVLRGHSVLAIAGVGDPEAFFRQLEQVGARVRRRPFPDHFPYRPADILSIRRGAESADYVVCTLKDAVKLHRQWPRSGPTWWYVSQRVDVVSGADLVENALRRLLLAISRTNR